MQSNHIKHLALLILLLSTSLGVQAQKNLPTGEVDIIKQFNARLIDAERYLLAPQLPPLDTSNRRQFYNILVRPLNISYLAPKIRPLEWRTDAAADIYKGYLQTGYGLPNAFYLDGSYDFITENNLDLGIDVYHYSANNNRNVENQRFGDTRIAVNGIYNHENGYSINGQLGYELNKLYYYGYNEVSEERSFAPSEVAQRFGELFGSAKIYNSERTALDFNYSAQADFYAMSDLFSAQETGFNLEFKGTKWFEEKHPLTLVLQTDFTGYSDTLTQSLNNIFLKPSFTFHADRFRIRLGVNLASSNDEYFIFPDLEATAIVVENVLSAFVGAEGNLQKNNLRSLSDYNPFILTRLDLRNSRFNHFFGGIKGEIKGIQYRGQIGYKQVDNLALFLGNRDTITRFNVLYDTAQIVSITGEITTQLLENFALTASFNQNFFTLEREEKPWHLPSLTLSVGGVMTLLDEKLKVRADLFLENGVPARDFVDNSIVNLDPLYDLSLGAQYQFTENIGGFVRVNNLLSNQRQRWQNYPVLPTNGLVGITARF